MVQRGQRSRACRASFRTSLPRTQLRCMPNHAPPCHVPPCYTTPCHAMPYRATSRLTALHDMMPHRNMMMLNRHAAHACNVHWLDKGQHSFFSAGWVCGRCLGCKAWWTSGRQHLRDWKSIRLGSWPSLTKAKPVPLELRPPCMSKVPSSLGCTK